MVISRAGRDRGEKYLVMGTLEGGFVLVADGHRRPAERPKKKNVKHLAVHEVVLALRRKLAEGGRVSDEELRAALAAASGEDAFRPEGGSQADSGRAR
ncbi:MAG: KOW domain-containing RNA-binding protein [Armatimonadetes bacterium]|nr:KOW domain-containing RNA-binding protein [Armatimonadota bacterium]